MIEKKSNFSNMNVGFDPDCTDFLVALLLDPEDGGDMLFRNIELRRATDKSLAL
jgi:hypothetical protein